VDEHEDEGWRAYWARAVDECLARGLPIPSEEELRAEYVERAKQLAGLDAWSESRRDGW
jgi:hypothetical protein